jgi:hypothetical protein
MSLCIGDRLVCSLIQTRTPSGYFYTVTYIRCRIGTIDSPDDRHMAARNVYRIEINIHEKELCVTLVIYKDKILYKRCIYLWKSGIHAVQWLRLSYKQLALRAISQFVLYINNTDILAITSFCVLRIRTNVNTRFTMQFFDNGVISGTSLIWFWTSRQEENIVISKSCVAILIKVVSGIVHNYVSEILQTLVFIGTESFMTYLSILCLNTDTIWF